MKNVKIYLEECCRMATLKKQDENIKKVYSDVNFVRLIKRAEEHLLHQQYLDTGDYIFNNVSQSDDAAEHDQLRPNE